MAEPIQHDFGTKAVTASTEAIKGGLMGLLVSAAIGAVVGAGIIGLVGAALAGITTWLGFSLMAETTIMSAATSVPGIIGGLVGAGVGTATIGAPSALIGGLVGLNNGANRINAESKAFEKAYSRHHHLEEQKQNNIAFAGMQQGYIEGVQDGAQQGQMELIRQLKSAEHEQTVRRNTLGKESNKYRELANQTSPALGGPVV